MANADIYAIVSTIENYENGTVTLIFVSNNSVQSTVTNNNSNKQTAIVLALIFPNFRITLFPCSNIQGNVTIIFMTQMIRIGSLIYWKVMFNTCDKYGELFCWFLHVIYFVVILMNKHKFIYSFTIYLFQSWLNMW